MRHILIGSDDFAKFVSDDNLFVDKSLFIKSVIDNRDDVVIITRPRRWGKSLNMSMLQYFFAAQVRDIKTKGMFGKLKIAKVEGGKYIRDHQGKYPVIFISFKDVNGSDYSKAIQQISLLIGDLFISHKKEIFKKLDAEKKTVFQKYIAGNFNEAELEKSLGFLSQCLYEIKGQKVYILVDEYDRPLNTAFKHDHSFPKLTKLIGGLFGACLKTNPYLEKGIITGVFRIAKAGIFSELNNAREYCVLDEKFAEFYGFTEEEVDDLCKQYAVSKPMRYELRKWYNGYKIGGITIYNPWSVMSALSDNKVGTYWIDTANNQFIKDEIRGKHEVHAKIDTLIAGATIPIALDKRITYEQIGFNNPSDPTIWSLFLHTGYLTADSYIVQPDSTYLCNLRIPNIEVRNLFVRDMRAWLQSTAQAEFPEFLNCLLRHDITGFAKGVTKYLSIVFNFKDLNKNNRESFYHVFIGMLLSGLWNLYYITSNGISGDGFPDILMIPRKKEDNSAFILEFKSLPKNSADKKMKQECAKALSQIDTKKYITAIVDHKHITEVYKIGMVFSGKRLAAKQKCEKIKS